MGTREHLLNGAPAAEATSAIRMLLCKSGLEEHDRGVRYLARRLVEAGMEVVYVVFHDPVEIGRVAVQENVDVVGISSSAGGHLAVVAKVRRELDERGAIDVAIVVGGVIPDAHAQALADLGVLAIFGPGSSPVAIIATIEEAAATRRARTGDGLSS